MGGGGVGGGGGVHGHIRACSCRQTEYWCHPLGCLGIDY